MPLSEDLDHLQRVKDATLADEKLKGEAVHLNRAALVLAALHRAGLAGKSAAMAEVYGLLRDVLDLDDAGWLDMVADLRRMAQDTERAAR